MTDRPGIFLFYKFFFFMSFSCAGGMIGVWQSTHEKSGAADSFWQIEEKNGLCTELFGEAYNDTGAARGFFGKLCWQSSDEVIYYI